MVVDYYTHEIFGVSNSRVLFLAGSLRRGVRSGVQLSCTEIRFQKCSQSGKNGSKHPILYVSIASLQCDFMQKNPKTHSKNQNRWILLCKLWLRNHQNYPKQLHSIAICSIFFIGMVYFRCYLVDPHVCLGGSEYVCQRGVEGRA